MLDFNPHSSVELGPGSEQHTSGTTEGLARNRGLEKSIPLCEKPFLLEVSAGQYLVYSKGLCSPRSNLISWGEEACVQECRHALVARSHLFDQHRGTYLFPLTTGAEKCMRGSCMCRCECPRTYRCVPRHPYRGSKFFVCFWRRG